MRRLFSLQCMTLLTRHRESAALNGTIVGMDTEEIDTAIQMLGADLSHITVDLIPHNTLANNIVNLKVSHALALNIQHA